MRLEEAGLTGEVLDAAISSFILEVVARHGELDTMLLYIESFKWGNDNQALYKSLFYYKVVVFTPVLKENSNEYWKSKSINIQIVKMETFTNTIF